MIPIQFHRGMPLREFLAQYGAANTAAIVQYKGLKYSDDESDACWLAKLARLGLLLEGNIYPNEVHLVTDGLATFAAVGAQVAAYGAIIVSPRKSSDLEPFRWVNTYIANCKTAINGTYRHFDFNKYRHRYLAEAQYCVNRRFDLHSLVGRLMHACARTEPCPEGWLWLAEVRAS